MLSSDEEIEKYKKDYLSMSDTDLLRIMHTVKTNCSVHIAAAQIKEERNSHTAKRTECFTRILLILTVILVFLTVILTLLTVTLVLFGIAQFIWK
jgi:hypothetical protein